MTTAVEQGAMRLVETLEGTCDLVHRGNVHPGVPFRADRYQGFARSGLPVPGVQRIEGVIQLPAAPGVAEGAFVTLRLEDGRELRMTVTSADGRVLAEGHGPSRCLCC